MEDPSPPPYSEQDPNLGRLYNSLPTRNRPPPSLPQDTPSSEPPFVSGAAYFAMRPSPSRRCGRVTSVDLALFPGSSIQDMSIPTPIQKSRSGVEVDDWTAFLNHLMPLRTTAHSPSMQIRNEKNGTITTSRAPPPIATIPCEAHLKRVVEEWNRGFFLRRGISIVLQTQPASKDPSPLKKNTSQMGEALYEAVKAQDLETTQILLSHGADPDYRPSCGTPQIVHVAKKGNSQILQLLLERGPSLEASAPGDGTALYYAIKAKDLDSFKSLLLYGASINNAHPSGGEPALYRAAQMEDTEILRLLLAQPHVDLEKKPPGGATSLYKAVKEENLEMVQLLLSHGAKAECKEPGGATAMHKAAKRGDVEMTHTLLEAGANVDSTPPGGNTALYEAVKNHDVKMVGLLLRYGADPNKKSCGHKSALTLASKNRETEMVKKLLGEA